MLYNIRDLKWDEKLLQRFDIPVCMLPKVCNSSEIYGYIQSEGVQVPISGIAGDQQAALFGQACFEQGSAKNTYGTGCFLLMNIGQQFISSKQGLITTIAATSIIRWNMRWKALFLWAAAVIQWRGMSAFD